MPYLMIIPATIVVGLLYGLLMPGLQAKRFLTRNGVSSPFAPKVSFSIDGPILSRQELLAVFQGIKSIDSGFVVPVDQLASPTSPDFRIGWTRIQQHSDGISTYLKVTTARKPLRMALLLAQIFFAMSPLTLVFVPACLWLYFYDLSCFAQSFKFFTQEIRKTGQPSEGY